MQVPREPVALFLRDLHHAQALGRELLGELHVLERDTGRAGEGLRERFVVGAEGAIELVDDLQHAQPAAVARLDGRDEDRAGAEAGALIGARVEARVVIRRVDP